jgi:predicted nucleic acid-binding protein
MVVDLANWMPVDTSTGLLQQAWQGMDAAQVSYWDALIVAARQRSGAGFCSRKTSNSDRQYDDIRIVDPFIHAVSQFILK